jgi:preprotein translocase subunit SecG
MLNFVFYTSMILFIIVCLFLILLILIQKGRGGGLASAFGGAGGNTAFGSKTGDVLTWATSIVFGVFIVLAVVLNLISNHEHDKLANANAANAALSGDVAAPAGAPAPATAPAAEPVER